MGEVSGDGSGPEGDLGDATAQPAPTAHPAQSAQPAPTAQAAQSAQPAPTAQAAQSAQPAPAYQGYPPPPPAGYPVGYPAGPPGPQAPYGYPLQVPPPPPPPRRRVWPYLVALIVLAPLLFVGCAVIVLNQFSDSVSNATGGSNDDHAEPDTDPRADVNIISCAAADGRLHAVFIVHNSTSDQRIYGVTIAFTTVGGKPLADGSGNVTSLPAGATSEPVEVRDPELAPAEGYKCVLSDVRRI